MSALDVRLAALATRIGNYLRDTVLPRCETWVKLAADTASNSTVTGASSGLSFTAVANKTYVVRLIGSFTAAATTTGIGLQLVIPSGTVFGQAVHQATTTQTLTGHEQVASGATPQSSSGVRAAATATPIFAEWIIEIGATGGTVTLQFKSEVASSAVVLKKPTALGYLAI
jgi:RsiW-degrading membrane proteinase PrsW (M82 family)